MFDTSIKRGLFRFIKWSAAGKKNFLFSYCCHLSFLFKKNTGVGGRKNPLYGLICNKPTYIYNKFKPGTGGVGAQNRANRRAKNARATVCVDHNCGRFYNYLGLYPRFSYKSIDGYVPYPLPIGNSSLADYNSTNLPNLQQYNRFTSV